MLEMPEKKFLQNGFSLVEIMIALTILAVLSGTMFHALTSITPVSTSKQYQAYNVARQTMENLYEFVRADTYWNNDPQNPLNPSHNNTIAGVNNPVNLDGTNYQCLFAVTSAGDQDGDGQEDYRKVTGTVSW